MHDAVQVGMTHIPAYKRLETWQVSMTFVESCYKATVNFPREETYGLTSQLRRAAISIPANLAEGYCRRSTKVYANHVSIALGSHGEIETYIDLAARLRFLPDAARAQLEQEAGSVGRLLSALHRSLKETIDRQG
jgi:four helix bundle protein